PDLSQQWLEVQIYWDRLKVGDYLEFHAKDVSHTKQGTVLGRVDKIEPRTSEGQWAEMTFLAVSDDHLLWWLNSGSGKDENWEFEVHFCKSGERSCRKSRRSRALDFHTDKFRNVPLGHLADHRIDWVKKSPCKKYVDEEVARMSGQRPKGQDETHPDTGQGLGFEEAVLSVAGAEDPALKNLSELERELGTPRKTRKKREAIDHHGGGVVPPNGEDLIDPNKKKKKRKKARADTGHGRARSGPDSGGGQCFGQEVGHDPKVDYGMVLEVPSGSSDNEQTGGTAASENASHGRKGPGAEHHGRLVPEGPNLLERDEAVLASKEWAGELWMKKLQTEKGLGKIDTKGGKDSYKGDPRQDTKGGRDPKKGKLGKGKEAAPAE
ncbi:unnamed protein product, partial [Symbiodinium necroappetens]